MFFGSFPSSDLIADKDLETEKKQNEAKLKRGRVYYENIKDHTRSSLPIVFVFFCVAEVVSIFSIVFFSSEQHCANLPIFDDSSPNCLWGLHMSLS